MKPNIKKYIKKLPFIEKFIRHHNPMLKDMIEFTGVIDKEKSILVDVGANRGQSIEFFLKYFPKSEIFSFEPTASIFKSLRQRFKNKANVHVFDLALSDNEGETVFYTSEFSPTNSLYKPNVKLYKKHQSRITSILDTSKEERCRVTTFNKWYSENLRGEIIDFMKIDVQGAEYDVLMGCKEVLSQKVKAVAIELQYLDFYKGTKMFYEVIELLYERHFFLYNYFETNKTKKNQLLENNAFFINKSFFS